MRMSCEVLELAIQRVHHNLNITHVGHITDDSSANCGGEDSTVVAGRSLAEAKKSGKLPPGGSADIDPSSPTAIVHFYAAPC
jgi:hypothetical protein